ncbi:YcgL domain-containing protein [Gammaproteobacteria bacterium]|nr:YcgL domain-containing protein [Gammaproteobacteria bacterium]
MRTWVYRCCRKADTFLYLAREDAFDVVPEALMKLLGDVETVMSLDLSARERLARIDVHSLQQHLTEDGYWLQMPPNEPHPFDRDPPRDSPR